MPIIKFVNESEKIEYPTEQDVCSLLCYAFAPQKTIMNDNQFVGCKPFGFPFWYMRNPLAVHQFSFKSVVQLNLLWQLHWQERKDFDFFVFHCVPPNKNRTIHADCPAKVKGEHPKTLSQLYI